VAPRPLFSCQQEVLSRKNGASRKHHNIKQLQQNITAVRHQGKTKTPNISLFFLAGFLENFKDGLWIFPTFFSLSIAPLKVDRYLLHFRD
jgi:zinc transporter ZupT